MKARLHTFLLLFAVLFFAACKKEEIKSEEEEVKTSTTPSAPTEGNIKIVGTQNDQVIYDGKTITLKSFNIDKILPYIYASYAQITIQSTDKDGIFNKYSIGINLLSGLPATGIKTNIIMGSTPLIGLNEYENSALYSFSAMNGTFTVDSNDGHNAIITVSDIDMKESYAQGFDASLKKFTIKSFKIKIAF